MQAFLYQVAQTIEQNYKENLDKLCIVLPNKRGALFLKNHLNVNAEGYKFVDGQLEDIYFRKRFSISVYLQLKKPWARQRSRLVTQKPVNFGKTNRVQKQF